MHIEDYKEEVLKAMGYTMQEIEEMDIDEKRMNIGWD
mgnify:CR=1 FL=1|tara:strand:- start:211 stop:321 length:111 start_codon:yes stop_codon:yes gene_type:complete